MKRLKHIFIIILLLISWGAAGAQLTDTVKPTLLPDSLPPKKNNLIQKVIDYFEESNEDHSYDGLDISFIGGPYYSSDTKLGLGLVAAGLYHTDKTDSLSQPSNVSLYLEATTSMFFQLGVEGYHIFPGDNRRITYDINFSSVKSKFWGIGYDMDVNPDNESKYKYLASEARGAFLWHFGDKLFIGPAASFDYVNGRGFEKPWLWENQSDRTFNVGVGFKFTYDSRDNLSNAYKGIYIALEQRFNPRFLLNKYAFSLTEITANGYQPLWSGAILAGTFHTRLTYGNTPWGLLSTFGGSHIMRGYYEGRYRDKCEADVCLELRQHIWKRNGVVAWIGAGTVFPEFKALRWSKVLPNWGVGYRWEFKKRVNVRIDFGFGRHESGFMFGINEAF